MKVRPETLDFDSGLVGDEGGISGVVISRFYHHVIGTPMFQVNFGGAIGKRPIRVIDTELHLSRSAEVTPRTLFPSGNDTDHVGARQDLNELTNGGIVSIEELPNELDDDPEWQPEYEDFLSQERGGDTSEDGSPEAYVEDPFLELGLYNFNQDVSGWPFEQLFADDQW